MTKRQLGCILEQQSFTCSKSAIETADLVTFTEEILNRKLNFLCSVGYSTLPLFSKNSKKKKCICLFYSLFTVD